MKRHIFAGLLVLLGLTLSACGQRQDTSARGSVYEARTYTTNNKTHKATKAVEMTLYLSRDDTTKGVLSTATLEHAPYYRRYELLKRKTSGAKTTLTTTGEVAAMTFSSVSDAEAGVNPQQYSYSQKGNSQGAGTYTKTAKGLDLKLGQTTWHFVCTEKKTRFLLPYGIANQAKDAKVDQK